MYVPPIVFILFREGCIYTSIYVRIHHALYTYCDVYFISISFLLQDFFLINPISNF